MALARASTRHLSLRISASTRGGVAAHPTRMDTWTRRKLWEIDGSAGQRAQEAARRSDEVRGQGGLRQGCEAASRAQVRRHGCGT